MEASAINIIQATAVEAQKANILKTDTPAIVLRDSDGNQHIESLEPYGLTRSRFRGTFTTGSLQDFARYVLQQKGGEGFIDAQALAAKVFFNLKVDGSAGHADHRSVLQLKFTPQYEALRAASQVRFGQKPIVEWLEDWWDCLEADYPNGDERTQSDPLNMLKALTAVRKVKVKAKAESTHVDKDFGSSRSAMEDIEASSDDGLPRGFRFTCRPCEDLDQRVFYLRLGVTPKDDAVTFTLRWNKRDTDIEAVAQDFKAKILNAIGETATMLLGSFDPGK